MGIEDNKFLSHLASKNVISRAISYVLMILIAIIVCFTDYQEIALPLRVNTYPKVDLISKKSYIQLASLYPSRTTG